MQSDI